jgi:hypothetical protein
VLWSAFDGAITAVTAATCDEESDAIVESLTTLPFPLLWSRKRESIEEIGVSLTVVMSVL